MDRPALVPGVVVAALWLLAGSVAADTVVFKHGSSVEGIVTEEGDFITVRVPEGTMQYSKDLVAEIRRAPTALQEYEAASGQVKMGDAEGHYRLGLYCESKGLKPQAEQEFRLAVRANPNHQGAHQKLGHVFEGGRWMTEEEVMTARGYVKYEGRWIPRNALELMQQERRDAQAQAAAQAQEQARARAEAQLRQVQPSPGGARPSQPAGAGSKASTNPQVQIMEALKQIEEQVKAIQARGGLSHPADVQRLLDQKQKLLEEQQRIWDEVIRQATPAKR